MSHRDDHGSGRGASATLPESGSSDPRQEELERIVRSETFRKSPRLAALLRHICERTWSGRTDELSEQQIGIHFFHRPPGFNAGEDAIVRGSARHLRKRLELFYATEGLGSAARLLVPKGGYVARLETSGPSVASTSVTPDDEAPKESLHGMRRLWTQWTWFAAALLAVFVTGVLFWRHMGSVPQEQNDGPKLLWETLFRTDKRTVIVPGDPTLNLYTAYVHHPVPLRDYMEQQYQHDPVIEAISPEGPGRLTMVDATTMADMKFVSELVRVPYREHLSIPDKSVEVRFSRDLNEADLHDANLVLLGSSTFDPWVTVYDKNLDFRLDRGFEHYTFSVLNKSPRLGETPVITKSDNEVLTIVALAETPSGNERALLIEASRMGGIYGAEHFLFTQRMWQPILDAATINGKLRDFEVVLKSDFVKDEVSNTRVITFHVH